MNETDRVMANSFCSGSLSHKYRITLLVTFEEELAIMNLFSLNGWTFMRAPDTYIGHQMSDSEQRDRVVNMTPYPVVQTSTVNTDIRYMAISADAREITERSYTELQDANAQKTKDISSIVKSSNPNPDSTEVMEGSVTEPQGCSRQKTQGTSSTIVKDFNPNPGGATVVTEGSFTEQQDTNVQIPVVQDISSTRVKSSNPNPDSTEVMEGGVSEPQGYSRQKAQNSSSTEVEDSRPGPDEGSDNENLIDTEQPSSDEQDDAEYLENSYFRIPPHVVKGFAGNTDVLSKTKKLLLKLSNDLKVLSSAKDVKSTDSITAPVVEKLNEDCSELKKETLETPTHISKAKTEAKQSLKTMHKKRKVKTQDKRGKGERKERKENRGKSKADTEKPKIPVKDYKEGNAVRNEVDKNIDAMSLVMTRNNELLCCMCKKAFQTENDFKDHASQCLSVLFDKHGSHVYKCTDCCAYFRGAFTLLRHRMSEVCVPGQRRTAGKHLICNYCRKTYPSRRRSEYIHHLQAHKNERPFVCEECGKDFVRWTTLRDHKKTHTGEKPFKCSYCPLTFVSGTGQRNHELARHADLPRKFVCEKCGAAFKLRNRLTSHLKQVHALVHLYVCEFCQKSFSRKDSLVHHRKTHINVRDKICDICGKGFIRQSALTGHMKRHRNERSYFCQECGKGFYTKINLADHVRTHTGDKPFSCTICNYNCACYSNAVKHVRTRHPDVTELKYVIKKASTNVV